MKNSLSGRLKNLNFLTLTNLRQGLFAILSRHTRRAFLDLQKSKEETGTDRVKDERIPEDVPKFFCISPTARTVWAATLALPFLQKVTINEVQLVGC